MEGLVKLESSWSSSTGFGRLTLRGDVMGFLCSRGAGEHLL